MIRSQADLVGRQADINALCQAALYSWRLAPGQTVKLVFVWRGQRFRSRLTGFRVLVLTMDEQPLCCHWGFVDEDAPLAAPEGWQRTLPAQGKPRGNKRRLRGQLTPGERYAILRRDGYRCRLCGWAAGEIADDGKPVLLHVDHITARSKGGNNDPMNLWTLCARCNIGKGSKDL